MSASPSLDISTRSARASWREDLARLRRASTFFRGHRRQLGALVLMALLAAAVNAIEPLILKYVFDSLSVGDFRRALVLGLGTFAGLALVREFLAMETTWLTWRTRLAVHERLLEAAVGRLHRLPVSFYRSEAVGALMTRLDRGIQGVVGAASEIAFQVLPALVYLVLSFVVMLRLEWRLALLVIVFAPLSPLIATAAAPEQRLRERRLLDRWTRIYSRFNQVLSGIVTVKSFTREEDEKRRFIRDVADSNQLVISGVRYDAQVQAGQNLVIALARIATIGFGGYLVLRGEITIGTLVAFLGYVTGLFTPVQGLSSIYRTFQTGTVSLDTVFSILDVQDTLGDAPDARDLADVRGEVRYEGVSFAYHPSRPILQGIDLDVRAGEHVALVGPSGGGKSTLLALLQRFYDPDQGRVLVDGQDIRGLKQESLRRCISVVLQESLLFDDSVLENIAYGNPRASRDEVVAAARAAQAHDFILALPEGYESKVGERGSRLSVGERQRIAIARALLRNAPILVFDEATSSLDAESEALVQEAMERLMAGRTTFVIAHRLATVVHADRVLVLKSGRIVESGSHAELMAASSYYASLVDRQVRGLLPDRLWERRSGIDRRGGEAVEARGGD